MDRIDSPRGRPEVRYEPLLFAEATDEASSAVKESEEEKESAEKEETGSGDEARARSPSSPASPPTNTGQDNWKPAESSPQRAKKKVAQKVYLIGLVAGIVIAYSAYFLIELRPITWPLRIWGFVVFVSFHIFFVLFLVAFYKSASIDPGRVPSQWGFKQGDRNKQRRYCKICNVWKPDRCHHCSSCNRCVLNMDHHCPWLNNCVGFENRRFFVQLLIYGLICCLFVAVHGTVFLVSASLDEFNSLANTEARPPTRHQAHSQGHTSTRHSIMGHGSHSNKTYNHNVTLDDDNVVVGDNNHTKAGGVVGSGNSDEVSGPTITNEHEDENGHHAGHGRGQLSAVKRDDDDKDKHGKVGDGDGDGLGDDSDEADEDESYRSAHNGRPIGSPPKLIDIIFGILQVADLVIVASTVLMSLLLIVALIPFLRFHLRLVAMNSTTIESLDKDAAPRRYDMGTPTMNCKQVFGSRPGCWGCPVETKGAYPVGDGVNWTLHYRTINNNAMTTNEGAAFGFI